MSLEASLKSIEKSFKDLDRVITELDRLKRVQQEHNALTKTKEYRQQMFDQLKKEFGE